MVPDASYCCYGLEYFCFEGDGLWASSDEQLLELAKSELKKIGLAEPADVMDGCVVRQKKAYPVYDDSYAANVEIIREELETRYPGLHLIGLAEPADVMDGCVVRQKKAYPVYDDSYAANVEIIREELETRYPGLHLVGRNGMHKYNNQDHAMMTALLTAQNIMLGRPEYNVWLVNQDAEYHEAGAAGAQSEPAGLRAVPSRIGSTLQERDLGYNGRRRIPT
jgi:protoporphyrinogen oxidase